MEQCTGTNEHPESGARRTRCGLHHPGQVGDTFTLPDQSKMVLGCRELGLKAYVYHHTQSNHLPVWRALRKDKGAMSLYKKRSKLY